MEETMIKNLEENTGKSLQTWINAVKSSGMEKHGQIVKWLKSEHGFTHGYANLLAHKAMKSDAGSAADTADLVEQQYSGKENLKPLYNALIKVIDSLGEDVEIAPKKSYVSLRRKKQFALIQPSTKTRLDLGMSIPGKAPEGRLEASGSFNSMVSHRVRLGEGEEVDAAIVGWLREAYEAAG